MIQRAITGTIFVIFIFFFLLMNLFIIPLMLFFIIGLYELFKIYKSTKEMKPILIIYTIVFLLGILSMNIIDMNSRMGTIYLIILFTSIMLNDTFAYLTGKMIGKRKFSTISPNKTIEGLLGGIVVSLICFIIYVVTIDNVYGLTIFSEINIVISTIIIGITLVFAVLGDLLESKLKREYKIKDSGTFIKGHGGILDRIDSWIVGSIVFLLLVSLYL